MRVRFFFRLLILVGLLFFFACSGLAVLAGLSAGIVGWLNDIGLPPIAAIATAAIPLLIIFLGFSLTARSLRRMAMPVASLMDAAGRVADGDYSARVSEHGTRELRVVGRAFNRMMERLQAHDEQRRSMLADITHELRTPLTVIRGNLEGLLDGVYPRDDAHLEAILDETRVMSRLVDDLYTLTLAESGALKLQKAPVEIALLIQETASSFQPQAARAEVALEVDTGPDILMLELDEARIHEVLSNLLTNALYYTPAGGTIRVACAANRDEGLVRVTVSDTGPGISSEDLPHIFERFYKSSASRGAGLGLAIAKNLVAAHGGDIRASSEVGQGTQVQFSLPFD